MTSAQVVAETAVLVEAYSQASDQLKAQAAAAAEAAWLSFEGWYNAALVAALAAETAAQSQAVQQAAAGLAAQFTENVTAAMSGGVRIPPVRRNALQQVIRDARNLGLVYTRPAERYKKAIATGKTHQEALKLAGLRAQGLTVTDLLLQEVRVQNAVMREVGVTGYRRVLRPELSKTGSCGLCIVAADRIYSTGDLMPIHPPSCKCIAMPIIGDEDPGFSMNREDLDRLYAEAGSNKAADLRRTRYTVQQHGEHGPVLTFAGDSFRGPDKVALEDDPERAARMLAAVTPVLADLEARGRAGEDVTGPLEYQRELIARLRRIVGA